MVDGKGIALRQFQAGKQQPHADRKAARRDGAVDGLDPLAGQRCGTQPQGQFAELLAHAGGHQLLFLTHTAQHQCLIGCQYAVKVVPAGGPVRCQQCHAVQSRGLAAGRPDVLPERVGIADLPGLQG